jgi:hypothetical protein
MLNQTRAQCRLACIWDTTILVSRANAEVAAGMLLLTLVVENESGLNQKGANTREAPTSQVPHVSAPMLQSEQLFTNSCNGDKGRAQ